MTEVTAYRTLEVDSAVPTEALDAVRKGEVDIISFFSASAFRSLCAKVGAEVLGRIPIAAIGPVTADAIREAGLNVTVESKVPTAKAFIAALIAHFPDRCLHKINSGFKFARRVFVMSFPTHRPRRLRRSELLRGMVRETRVATQD